MEEKENKEKKNKICNWLRIELATMADQIKWMFDKPTFPT